MENRYTLLLASASPRRRQLLKELGFPTRNLDPIPVDESFSPEMPPEEVPLFLSKKKSDAYADSATEDNEIIVTADTIVILNGKAIGKPADEEDALRMLRDLSGKTHKVVSGVTLRRKDGKTITFGTETLVHFSSLSDEEINSYVSRFHPTDKAGAYGIQEWIGYIGVRGIDGDYYNVMGLPLHDLYRHLKEL